MPHANIIYVTNLQLPELELYSRFSENQLLHYFEPGPGVFIAESPIVAGRALDAGYEPISILVEESELYGASAELISRCQGIPVYTAPGEVLTQLTGFALTRGLLCAMRRRPLPSVAKICAGASRIAILENVVNPTNIGAIFRSAAALNMDAVLLTSGCSDPLYRRAIRVSMGTVFQIPWTIFDREHAWPQPAMSELQKFGFKTAAMALTDKSVCIDDPSVLAEEKLAIVLGTEGDGLAQKNHCRLRLHHPYSYVSWSGFPECGSCQRRCILAARNESSERWKVVIMLFTFTGIQKLRKQSAAV